MPGSLAMKRRRLVLMGVIDHSPTMESFVCYRRGLENVVVWKRARSGNNYFRRLRLDCTLHWLRPGFPELLLN